MSNIKGGVHGRVLLVLAACGALCTGAGAQVVDGVPEPVGFVLRDRVPQHVAAMVPFVRPEAGQVAEIDWAVLDRLLATAPDEFSGQAAVEVLLPMPDHSLQRFAVLASSVMEPGLAQALPQVRTFIARGLDDPGAIGRFDVSQFGLRGLFRTSLGTVFVDPYSAGERRFVTSYFLSDAAKPLEQWICHTEHDALPPKNEAPGVDTSDGHEGGFGERGSIALRGYRLAMACTGEFGAFHSELLGNAPNQADALAAIVTIVNRTNLVFETDLGVRFVLVSNNNLLAFFDSATDPYPTPDPTCITDPAANCSGPYLSVNQSVINNIIGSANYDVGHLLTRVRGGVANLRSVCGSNKARGISGIPRGGELDPYSAFVPAHELGHQFGANHTFNGVLGRCETNINSTTSWEPGGGNTIMAYPGACPVGGGISGDNLVVYGDMYFHPGSLLEMKDFLENGAGGNCDALIPTNNLEPVIVTITPSQRPVPPATPFTLTAVVSDSSPNVVNSWEQYDAAAPRPLGAPDPGAGPLFRSFWPRPSASRTFPDFQSLLDGQLLRGEQFPTTTNVTRRFLFVSRDNQWAQTIAPVVEVLIRGTTPFSITSPSASTIERGAQMTVLWDVAGTTAAPFNAPTVRVEYSADDGQTWTVVATATPNDGSHTFALIGPRPAQGRVIIRPAGQIFFALSPRFAVLEPCDGIDFNNDSSLFDPQDIAALLSVYSEGPCVPASASCNDIDVNNDGSLFDPCDIASFLALFSEGGCTPCGE